MLVGENYAGKNWHFDIATYGLSSSACLFFPTIICHVCSLHYYHCYVVLISCQIFTKWIVCPQYYYVYQVTDSQGWTPHLTGDLWEQCIFWSSTTELCRPPVCHNKQDQQIRWERSRGDGKYCWELLSVQQTGFIRHLYTDLCWSVREVKGATK